MVFTYNACLPYNRRPLLPALAAASYYCYPVANMFSFICTHIGHPNLNLTPEEKRVFYKLFQAADKTNLGVVTGEVAVSFFEKTSLPPETLGLIWQIADTQNRGLLTPSGFGVVMRLIGHAQAGRAPTEELALQPGPLPKFSGLTKDIMEPTPQAPPVTSSPPPGSGPVRVPPLAPEDITKFTSLFERSEVHNGLLSGESAKQIFERARLPNEVLGRIWNLADTKQRGALDATEFIIAMHLLSAYRNGTMRVLPQALPPGLYDAAARRGGARTSTGSRSSSDVPPVPAIPKQFSGSGPQRAQSPLNRAPQFLSTISVQSTGGDWTITPQEKAHFDTVFTTIDKANLGYITGDQAVEFFTNAQLPEETLASIWDLADIDSDGQLSKDEFAVAMYLVRQQRTTREPLPQALPPALIPPSMRRQAAPGPAPQIVPQNTAQRSAAEDLFGLDVFGPPVQAVQTTGGSNTATQPSPSSPTRSPLSGSATASATSTFKPFVPSSTFGQSLTPHTTGLSNVPVQQRSPPPSADDLLADVDLEASKKVSQESVDLANLSNQIGSLSREMQNVQGKRAAAEQDLTQNSQQKKDFEARLAQARTMYEQEARDFKALEDRLAASRTETRKLQQDFALIEASRQDLQNQYNQLNAALDADQRENASLKEQIREANAQVSQLKPLLEKARSAARQQKGLVAINKKQLATVEGERDRMQGEIDSTTREVDELQRQASEIPSPVSQPPPVASPAPSTASQTNPFFRRTTSMSENSFAPPPPSSSQEPSKDPQSVFDNVFGPSFTVPATSTPPPPTSFRTEPLAQQQTFTATGPEKASGPSGSLTPSSSPTSVDPPPPPQSRQISSSQLPIEGHHSSEASSVKPSPPASRFGASVTSEREASSSTKSPFDIEEPNPDATQDKPPTVSERSTSRIRQEPETSDIPGSFPAEPTQPESESESTKKDASFDELFGGITHARSPSQKANDFEEAFAAMKVKTGGGESGFPEVPAEKPKEGTSEFPPIREFDDDEESTDSEAAKGFDDDFSPVSPPRHNEPVSTVIISPEPFTSPVPGTSFPGINGEGPSRAVPPAAAPASNGLTHVGKHDTGNSQPALPVKKAAVPDFEAAFAGLELAPAKEADDDEDDEEDDDDFESPFNKDSSNFDMTFDSPGAPSKPSTMADATAGTSSGNNTMNTGFLVDSNRQLSTSPFALKSGSANPPAPVPGNGSQDWDALFSALDSSKTPNDVTDKPTTSEGAQPSDSDNLASFPQPPGKEAKPPGWALSADTGEDDLILQRLTGMGYPRDESLAALEKFDYNIDKVG
ncbi:hypothetical protein ACJ72_06356 [Emergomyces africanus]|uniref:Actin cytoskeleton-regulatory complex protein END3 n=1 Tax=Emergomyces africanus TaxID=1955775 RepID=A0A1B7NRA7_9EURO|nr:hypothetical protein ACJ72_06356 [Emergomyces africanus]